MPCPSKAGHTHCLGLCGLWGRSSRLSRNPADARSVHLAYGLRWLGAVPGVSAGPLKGEIQ